MSTGWPKSYRNYILQITQPSQYRYSILQYRFAVISGQYCKWKGFKNRHLACFRPSISFKPYFSLFQKCVLKVKLTVRGVGGFDVEHFGTLNTFVLTRRGFNHEHVTTAWTIWYINLNRKENLRRFSDKFKKFNRTW